MAKSAEYKFANYDGRLVAFPEAGDGKLEITEDGYWLLHFGFRKNVTGDFAEFPFVVAPLGADSTKVLVHAFSNPKYEFGFELPGVPAQGFVDRLHERGLAFEQLEEKYRARQQQLSAGQWWVRIKPYRILLGCHYSGARNKGESGNLDATKEGISYKAVLGAKVNIPWSVIRDIEISTQNTKRVTAGRALAIGVFALAAKKNETFTYIHIEDPNTIWSFATKASQPKVLAAMKPITDAFHAQVQPTQTQAAPSVADELAKLAQLKQQGVLTDEEFAAQKAKLLSARDF
ncbi:MAG: SHOCT domain-containing protein [Acidimicrobiales bacterium]